MLSTFVKRLRRNSRNAASRGEPASPAKRTASGCLVGDLDEASVGACGVQASDVARVSVRSMGASRWGKTAQYLVRRPVVSAADGSCSDGALASAVGFRF